MLIKSVNINFINIKYFNNIKYFKNIKYFNKFYILIFIIKMNIIKNYTFLK